MSIIFQLFFLLFVIAFCVSLFSYSFFWYENAGRLRRPAPGDPGKGPARILLLGILSGTASIMLVTLFYPLAFIRKLWRPREVSASQPVIVLVHGLYHNASAWLLFRHRLKKAGFTNIYVLSYRSFFTSFDSALEKLQKFLEKSRPAGSGQPLILIGHSLGGLLSRVHAERCSAEDAPAAVITLGAPHNGSKMVAFALGRLGQSLRYRGKLFEKIESEGRTLPCPGLAIYSPADSLVLPAEGLEPPSTGWMSYETSPMSHVSMLFSGGVARKVIEFLRK